MKKDESHNRVQITEAIRLAIKEKRQTMRYSFNKAASCIGVHWSTFRKWETGETTHYTRETEQRVMAFLEDEVLEDVPEARAELLLAKLIKRLRFVYRVIPNQYQFRYKFLDDMENLIDRMLETYSRRGSDLK